MKHIFISTTAFITILVLALYYSQSGLKWNCDNPILSNYLYLILSFVSVYMFISILSNTQELFINRYMFFGAAILTLILIYLIITIPPKNFITKHIFWFIFLFLISYIMTPRFLNSNSSIYVKSIVISIIIFVGMSILGYIYKDSIPSGMSKYLLAALIVLILAIIMTIIFGVSREYIKSISIIGIIIFVLFILVDTKRLYNVDCDNVDYINNSTHLFLDGINLFSSVHNLQN
jgi:FtsH-binding integral membrane protein